MPDDIKLELKRTFKAAPERVFAAWTTPEVLRQWMAPGPLTCPVANVDLRPGGAYRFEMEEPGGARHVALGTFREIVANQKLVMTWCWEGGETETLLTVEFRPSGTGTDMTLVHERFADEADRQRHDEGWGGCLAKLEGKLGA